MSLEVMKRSASDNKYLHRDFHLFMNRGLLYLEKNYGEGHVKEYLTRFSRAFYAPLKDDLKKNGLSAIKTHYEKIFETEECPDALSCFLSKAEDELVIKMAYSPAIKHIRKSGEIPAENYFEVEKAVNEELVSGLPYKFELRKYNSADGCAELYFKEVK
ncbi:hypothetical protein SDC9_85338 [bioreactor metagenome]|uniref:Uncharacterized protein n=1 Tax=bioreactor metagenome TaxID=1076179 RepID=A0A644ZEJ6_9ZZZZ|nr:hypothetical protein [Oscillospiraceae bacterium]